MPKPGIDLKITIGARLKEARENAGLTQGQVRKLTGIDQAKISRIEMGAYMTPYNIQKLATCYGVSTDWLFGLRDSEEISDKLKKELQKLAPADRVKVIGLLRSLP